MDQPECTAGIIVIGDEILKGQTTDTNSHFLCTRLFSLGVRVKKVSIIGDDLDLIAKEVAEFSNKFTHVITSGGIGPTHDDLTFEGVARAFGEPLVPHPELIKLCQTFFGTDDLDSPKLKMAKIPQSSRLQYGISKTTGSKTKYPLVIVKNVYLFPGVPSILENAFVALEDLFKNDQAHFHTQELYVDRDEISIAGVLGEAEQLFLKRVVLGSYPDFNNSYYKVKLTLESESLEHVLELEKYLVKSLPEGSIVPYDPDPLLHSERVYSLLEKEDSPFVSSVAKAIEVIEESLNRYSLDEICVGFNGGKDCTAILHLYYAIAKKKYSNLNTKLKALYITSKSPFPEVEQFIQSSRDRYQLEMLHFDGRIQDSLSQMKKQYPEIKAVVMGTRKTDPWSAHLESFSMTDPDWPQYMRINPILDWSFRDVWEFLRSLCLPYCSLYDRGFTSLGSMNNTHPNPQLRYIDNRGIMRYKAAFLLADESEERNGRDRTI
ncbi:hypothetical protein ScPMuIL_015465 [Solemya velum]